MSQSRECQPLVVAIEDFLWVDPSTEAFLSSLVEAIDRLPVLLLVTYRSGYQPPWGRSSFATQIALSPLTGSESWELMQTVLQDRDVDRSTYRQIEAKAQGNPFFLEEFARALEAEEADGDETLHIPYTVQTLLAARLDRLSPNAKYLLQIAAVFGSQVPLASLQAVVAWTDATLSESLEQLRAAELLYESHLCLEPTYTFRHPLVQEVAYALLLRRTQRELYQRIVQVLTLTPTALAETQRKQLAHRSVSSNEL
jgi:adenylate cyclase